MMHIRVLGKNGRPLSVEVRVWGDDFFGCWRGGWSLIRVGLALALHGRTGVRFAGQIAIEED